MRACVCVCVQWPYSTHTRRGGVHMLRERYLFISSNCRRVDRSSRRLICLWQWVQKNSSASDWRKLWKLAGKELGLRRTEEKRRGNKGSNERRGEDTSSKRRNEQETGEIRSKEQGRRIEMSREEKLREKIWQEKQNRNQEKRAEEKFGERRHDRRH